MKCEDIPGYTSDIGGYKQRPWIFTEKTSHNSGKSLETPYLALGNCDDIANTSDCHPVSGSYSWPSLIEEWGWDYLLQSNNGSFVFEIADSNNIADICKSSCEKINETATTKCKGFYVNKNKKYCALRRDAYEDSLYSLGKASRHRIVAGCTYSKKETDDTAPAATTPAAPAVTLQPCFGKEAYTCGSDSTYCLSGLEMPCAAGTKCVGRAPCI
jgi:hypothetical protein